MKLAFNNFISTTINLHETLNQLNGRIFCRFLGTIVNILLHLKMPEKSLSELQDVLNNLISVISKVFSRQVDGEQCEEISLMLVNKSLSSTSNAVWEEFKNKLLMLCIQSINSGEIVKEIVDKLLVDLKSSSKLATCQLLKMLVPNLDKELLLRVMQSISTTISDINLGSVDESFVCALCEVIVAYPISVPSSELEKLLKVMKLDRVFEYSLKENNGKLIELCYRAYKLCPSSKVLNVIESKYLLELLFKGGIFTKLCEMLVMTNVTVRQVLMKEIGEKKIKIDAKTIEVICPILNLILKIENPKSLPEKFRKLMYLYHQSSPINLLIPS